MFRPSSSSVRTMPRGKEVGAGVGHRVVRLFGREVLVLARDHLAFLVVHQVEGLRDAEVGELHVALVGHQDVLRADVPVDDVQVAAVAVVLLVGVGEAPGDARDDEGGEVDGDLLAQLAVLVDEDLEVHAADKFHHHEILPADLAEMVGLDDVGMDQVRDQPGLADEVLLELLDRREFLADQLDGHDFLEIANAELHRLVDHAHAALRELVQHLVVNLVEEVFDGRHDTRGKSRLR